MRWRRARTEADLRALLGRRSRLLAAHVKDPGDGASEGRLMNQLMGRWRDEDRVDRLIEREEWHRLT